MIDTQNMAPKLEAVADRSEFSFIDFLIVISKHKKTVIGFPLIVTIVAAIISISLPDVFKASTRLLPPQQAQSGAAALLSQLGGVAGAVGGAAGIKNPSDLYIGMLRSRTIGDRIIQRFNLMKTYQTDSQEKARKFLEEDTTITASKEGLISIEVESTEKKNVAAFANAYVEELLKLTKVLAITEAAQRRLFFEGQLEQAKNNLVVAETTLKVGLESHGVISVDSDTRAVVETVGRMRAQLAAKEIQLRAMEAFVTTSNQEYKRVNQEVISLRSEISKLQNGRPADGTSIAAGMSTGGIKNIQVLRDVKYYEMLYEMLAKQYELARLDEAKDATIIQVLDRALEPERKSKPRRAVIVMLSAMLSFCLAIIIAFFHEARNKSKTIPTHIMKVEQLRKSLVSWR